MREHPAPVFIEITTDISSTILRAMDMTMLTIRRFEERVAELLDSRPKIICPVHLDIGEEAYR